MNGLVGHKGGGSAPGAVWLTETIRGRRECSSGAISRQGATAHAQESEENTLLTSILVQVFIYLELFMSTSIVWYGMTSSERNKVLWRQLSEGVSALGETRLMT